MTKVALIFLVSILPLVSNGENCSDAIKSSAELYRCALAKDPRVLALVTRRSEREGRESEARQFPNPRAESEFTFDSESQQKVSVLQPIEIGGKRSARIKIAESENKVSMIEDDLTLVEVASDLAVALVRHRQLSLRSALLEETKTSLQNLTSRLRAKAVRTPEERNALTIFSVQNTLLGTQILSLKQDLKDVRSELEIAVGRRLSDAEQFTSSEKVDWPTLDSSRISESFESRLATASVSKAEAAMQLQQSLGWPELAIGPAMEMRKGVDTSWGAKIELSIPIFNVNGGAKRRSRAEFETADILAKRTKLKEAVISKNYFEQYGEVTKFLKANPSQSAIKKSVKESLQLFSRGMIQPAAIVESYRSTLETLEAVQQTELTAYRLYWKLSSYSGDIPKEFL